MKISITFDNMIAQKINFYYLLEPIKDLPNTEFQIEENDKGIIKNHVYNWIALEQLNDKNLEPLDISKLLSKGLTANNILLSDDR